MVRFFFGRRPSQIYIDTWAKGLNQKFVTISHFIRPRRRAHTPRHLHQIERIFSREPVATVRGRIFMKILEFSFPCIVSLRYFSSTAILVDWQYEFILVDMFSDGSSAGHKAQPSSFKDVLNVFSSVAEVQPGTIHLLPIVIVQITRFSNQIACKEMKILKFSEKCGRNRLSWEDPFDFM
jgi:hypothetical protein